MVCDGNDCSAMEETKKEVTELRENLTYLTHQIYRIVLALHVPLCQCAVCAAKHQIQNDLIIQSTNIINGTNGDQSDCSAHSSNGVEVPNGVNGSHPITPDVAPFAAEGASEQSPSNATPQLNNVDCQALLSQLFAPVSNGSLMMSTPLSAGSSPLYSGRGRPPLGVTVSPRTQPRTGQPPGRKSKYCTAGEKKAVAIYAAQHGASAAARKFNIPPAVAAYYHRKEYKRGLPKGRRPSCAGDAPSTVPIVGFPTMVPPTEASPGTVSDDHDSFNDDWKQDEMAIDADHSNADNSARDSFKSSADSFYAGSDGGGGGGGGSPAFLRGRGRGRPKLIGDELDADLVDFMVRVKQEDPRRHISATRALERARDYIREKAPGLLEEDGGVIKLRLTWAMKLMARVAERERELFPSLHPASMPMLFPKRDVYNDLTDTVENVVASQVLAANGQLMH